MDGAAQRLRRFVLGERMKLWLAVAVILVAPAALAQCPVVLVTEPVAPSAERPTIIRLQDWRQHPTGSTPIVVSMGTGSITVEQAVNNIAPPPALPNMPCGVSPAVNLGQLAPGRYDVVWRYRDPNTTAVFETFARSFHVNEPTIPTLSQPLLMMLMALVAVAGMLMLRTR